MNSIKHYNKEIKSLRKDCFFLPKMLTACTLASAVIISLLIIFGNGATNNITSALIVYGVLFAIIMFMTIYGGIGYKKGKKKLRIPTIIKFLNE